MAHIMRNDVRLAYDEAGQGGPPMLFVHGFGGDARHFAPQMEHFRLRHRVVAIDRRGHGRSDKPSGPYSVTAIAEEVGFTARELGLAKPVLVVHSMGAIGLEAVAQRPDQFSALVVLDAPAFPPPEVKQAFTEFLEGLRSPGYRDAIATLCDRLIFLPTDDPTRRERLHEALLETPQHVLEATWEGFLAYDPLPAAKSCRIPMLYIGSVMPVDAPRLREVCPQIVIGRTVGAGHMHQVEVPDQVNAMIERFLKISL